MEPIAIIGIGCRFPTAKDPEAFWHLLQHGQHAIAEVPQNRWNAHALYHPEPATPGKMNTRWGSFLEGIDLFDPGFFGISPREAVSIDPQHRLILEVTWEALENAGLAPNNLDDSQTGVFLGIVGSDYGRFVFNNPDSIDAYGGTGITPSIAANRVSYMLNLHGPSLVIDTACSSSLVALHFACQSLQSGESNLCLVGGVNLTLSPEYTLAFSQARMMATDGLCKAFDATANGYVRGEGCGVIVIKRLSDALQAEDNILAIIRGSAVNHDGLSNGITAPNGRSQQAAIKQALKNAGVAPAQISYVEAHGTGTSLGDPIEVESIQAVLGQGRSPDQHCYIGSVKTNIGHLEAAAGIAGLIKIVLSLHHQQIPPHLHLKQLNPLIELAGTPFVIPTESQSWPVATERRFAGLSSFSFGGTNCHVILEEAPRQVAKAKEIDRPIHLLTLSAKSEKALLELAQRYETHLNSHPEALADICYTANTGRWHFDHRLAVIATSSAQVRAELSAFAAGKETSQLVVGEVRRRKPWKIAFLFSGQGSQYLGMGRQLYETQPTFRAALDRCDEILRSYLKESLLSVLYFSDTGSSHATLLDETAYTQPALFALQYALFQLWQSWGIKPSAVIGHSVGEYVAACVAGVFSLEDGLKLIATRGRLMQQLPCGGKMLSLLASESQVQEAIAPYASQVAIAAFNSPNNVVISGDGDAIDAIASSLEMQGVKTKQLQVSHAFHSPLMEPMMAEFAALALQVTYNKPQIPLISNITGEWVADDDITTPEYWVRHIRQPVRFADSMQTLDQEGYEVFLEIGSKAILLGMGRQCLPEHIGLWLPSLRPDKEDWQQMLESLEQLYVKGVKVDWSGLDRDYVRRKMVLPTYPFQRERHWLNTTNPDNQNRFFSTEPSKNLGNLLYEVEWQLQVRSHPVLQPCSITKSWLIFADRQEISLQLAKQLRGQNVVCILVFPGQKYQQISPEEFIINPENPDDYSQLLAVVAANFPDLSKVLHLWSLNVSQTQNLTIEKLKVASKQGCATTLYLVQALVKCKFLQPPCLWLLTQGAQPVLHTKNKIPGLAQSPLWGMGRVISLEHPELWGGMLDLDVDTVDEQTAAKLIAEIWDTDGEDHIALRDGQRYVARLVSKSPTQVQSVQFQTDGTYLVTGGLGFLGLKLARWMVEQGARYLVLVGRKKLPEREHWVNIPQNSHTYEQVKAIESLEEMGATVVVLAADVTNLAQMSSVIQQVNTAQKPLRGIVHAAGLGGYQTLEDMELNELESVLCPKTVGAWILHQLTQDISLDFFIYFSSVGSVWGAKGQGHYDAANHFLDVLAYYRRSLGLPALSVNWGNLGVGGMASEAASVEWHRLGLEELQLKDGFNALDFLLGSNAVQTAVVKVNWHLFKEIYQIRGQRSLLTEILSTPIELTKPSVEVKQDRLLERLETASVSEQENILVAYFQGEIAQVLKIKTSQIDVQQPLNKMGLDSLMAVELRNQLKTKLEVDVPIVKFIEGVTIVDLANQVNQQLTEISRYQAIKPENQGQIHKDEVKEQQRVRGEV